MQAEHAHSVTNAVTTEDIAHLQQQIDAMQKEIAALVLAVQERQPLEDEKNFISLEVLKEACCKKQRSDQC